MTDRHVQCVCAGRGGAKEYDAFLSGIDLHLYQTIELCDWSMQEGVSNNLHRRNLPHREYSDVTHIRPLRSEIRVYEIENIW